MDSVKFFQEGPFRLDDSGDALNRLESDINGYLRIKKLEGIQDKKEYNLSSVDTFMDRVDGGRGDSYVYTATVIVRDE